MQVPVLIIHLSDVHFSASHSRPLGNVNAIVDAALSPTVAFEAIHVVISGDLANWGLSEEFEQGRQFIDALREAISRRSGLEPLVLICAGNHDCNFSEDQSLRDMVIERVRNGTVPVTQKFTDELAGALTDFFEVQRQALPSFSQGKWFSVCEAGGPIRLRYVLLNSSMTSKKKEEIGKLYLVPPDAGELDEDRKTIYVMHHPYNWFTPENAREIALRASEAADIFLMGHEHVVGAQMVADLYEDTSTVYLKGHVLQDVDDDENSAFQTVQLHKTDGILLRSYRWEGGKYTEWAERTKAEYLPWSLLSGKKKLGITADGYSELNNPGANFTHRNKDVITLPDIFVWPKIRLTSAEKEAGQNGADVLEIDSEELLNFSADSPPIVVVKGGEQFGKSALARMLALNMSRRGRYPILLTASTVSSWREKSLNERIDRAIDAMYGAKSRADYRMLPPEQKVIIIDDFDLAQVSKGYFDGLRALRQHFGKIFLMLDSHPGLEVALSEFLRDEAFVDSDIFELLPSNYHHRIELIERWLRIGNGEQSEDEIRLTAARLSKVVDETLGRNLIPAVPVFVLIVLQRAELSQDLNTVVKSGSQGFLYESLIHQALSTRVKACSVVTSLTYLTEFAQLLKSLNVEFVSQVEFEEFHVSHCRRFALDLSIAKLQAQLVSAEILEDRGDCIRFRYPFHYYYFVARALAQIRDWHALEPEIDTLVDSIHTERSANVLLFLAHIGADARIAEKIIQKADAMLPSYKEKEADLFRSIAALEKFNLTQIRAIIHEGQRSLQLLELDRDEASATESQKELTKVAETRLNDRLADALAMNAAFKTLQVLGQVLRNHAGEIERAEKSRIASTCVSLGLRVLGFSLETVEKHADVLIAFRGAQIRSERPGLNDVELADELETYLPSFLSSITVGTLIKIANAIGAEDLSPTIREILSDSPTHKLMQLVIRLEHFADFPRDEILRFEEELLRGGAFLPNAVLRRFIVRRFYLFPIREELKRAVLERFNIKALPFKFLEQKPISKP
ncbi:MAG: STAND family AAA ATPase [Luteimonas sp.]